MALRKPEGNSKLKKEVLNRTL